MPKKYRNKLLTAVAGASLAAVACSTALTGSAQAASVSTWESVAQCESTGNWSIDTGNGYYGGLQFSLSTWKGYGGLQYAAYPNQATEQQQILVAEKVLAMQGPGAWPVCGPKAGLTNDGVNPYPSSTPAPTSTPVATPSVANGQVASVVINGTAHIFQVTSDGHIRMNDGYYPSGGWRGWVPLDGSGVVGLSAAAVGNTVHLFAVMSDGTLRETVGDYTTATWGGWHVVPGSNVAQLSAVTVAGKVRLYATLNDANGSPRSADLDPATDTLSTGWYDLTGGGVKQLVGTAVGDTVRLFAVTGDGLLHENDGNYDAGTWSGWNNVGGSQISTLAAATTGTTVHLYAGTTDGSFHSVDSTGNGQWSGWATQSGSLVDQLNALGDGQTVHLYAHTTDGLTHSEDANYSTSTWTNWYSL
ncbi:transglycosylase family protein [Kitasatospora sp. NPDC006697]|uniref:transglycosylase family protein n=1 Tax=Kitasatospora sp. NPDC006697 TaxID=3364020 RepID=UPI0036AEABA6